MANQGTTNRVSGHMEQDWAARLILWARCKLISPHPDIPLPPSSPLPPIVQAQDFPEQVTGHGHLGQLKGDVEPVSDDLGVDLDELLPCRGLR